MTDVHQARIEAAARAMIQVGGDGFGVVVERDGMSILDAYTEYALAALAAADAVVTVEQIEEVVQAEIVAAVGECICHEAYTSRNKRDPDCGWHWVGDDFASDTAKVIQRLYRGEEQEA